MISTRDFALFASSMLLVLFGCIPGSLAAKDYQEAGLKAHNFYRERHVDTPPMTLNLELNALADKCAEYYATVVRGIDHSCPYKGMNGENLAWIYNDTLVAAAEYGVYIWYEEIKAWDFDKAAKKEGGQGMTGHFTQVIWKGSTELGIGVVAEPNPTQKYIRKYMVGLYKPAGNFIGGTYYKDNVLPLKPNLSPTDQAVYVMGRGSDDSAAGASSESSAGAGKASSYKASWSHFIIVICFGAILSIVGMIA